MAATETLQELLIKIRTTGEKEAKEALSRAVSDAQKQQAALLKQQQERLQAAKEATRKALAEEARAEGKSWHERRAAKRAFFQHQFAEQKAHDRERIRQENAVQREIARAVKAGQRELERIEAKRLRDRDAALKAGSSKFMAGGQKLGDRIVGSAVGLAKATAVAGAGAAYGGFSEFEKFLGHADQIKTISHYTAMTTDRVQQLGFAATQNGMSLEKFVDGIRQFNAGMRESAKGGWKSGAVGEALKDLKIDPKQLENLDTWGQISTILQKGKELGPSFARGGLFAKLFGEIAGAQYARLADQGVESLNAMAASAKNLGVVLESATIDQAIRINQQLEATKGVVTSVKNLILAELLPIVEPYIVKIREWTLANRELIRDNTIKWLGELGNAAKSAWPSIETLVKIAAKLTPVLIEMAPTLLQIGVGLKGLSVASQVAGSIGALSSAFTAAQGSAAAFAGAGGIGAIIQGLVVLLPLAWKAGEALGNLDNQNTGARSSLATRIASATTGAFGVHGGEAYAEELARMKEDEAAKVEAEVMASERGRDRRTQGRLQKVFDQARSIRENAPVSDMGAIQEGIRADLRNRKTAKKYKLKDLESLVSQGLLTQEEFDLERGARNASRLTGARDTGGKKKDKVSDEELMKIIDKAVKSGANLDELLKGRKLAGTTPPVITIQQWITNVTATATMTTKARDGQSVDQIAQATVQQFNTWLSGEVRKAIPEARIAR